MVVATQNPFEFEGTYHLPENQLDRFILKVGLGYPNRGQRVQDPHDPARPRRAGPFAAGDERRRGRQSCRTRSRTRAWTRRSWITSSTWSNATRNHDQLYLGVSTRGALALTNATQALAVIRNRDYVLPDDVKELFLACCAHRVISKTYVSNGDAGSTARILQSILDRTPAPK